MITLQHSHFGDVLVCDVLQIVKVVYKTHAYHAGLS